jgi:hypothetical protein
MPVDEAGGYSVGQRGRIEVLDGAGRRRFEVEGEIVRLIPVGEDAVWALIRTRAGTGVYRVW